jgi:hypothetical protein
MSRGRDTILAESRHVQVLHNGVWHRGDLTATRFEPGTGWRGVVRFIVGVGLMHWHWKHASELRRLPRPGDCQTLPLPPPAPTMGPS